MASDLARLFALAHDYHLKPSLYRSRAAAYDIKSGLFKEFIGILMSPEENEQKLTNISSQLGIDKGSVLPAGIHFMHEIIFSADRNYYEILGIRRDASSDVVKKHYRYLITMFHPDKCAACELDGETYAALLNTAYNTLKNNDSRRAYDDTLNYRARVKVQSKQAANSPYHTGDDVVSTKNKSPLFDGFINQHPKLVVWSLLVAAFLLVVYVSSFNTDIIGTEQGFAVKPAVEIREQPALRTITKAKKDRLVDEKSDYAYLEESINSETLDGLLEVSSRNVVSSAVDLPDNANQLPVLSLNNTEDSVAIVDNRHDKTIKNDQNVNNFQANSKEVPGTKATEKDSIIVIAGFDGGEPGTSSDIQNLAGGTDYMRKPLIVETFSMPPELIMMKLVESYESGDIDKFSQLFSDDVITKHGRGKHHIINRFSSLFNATTLRKINIKQLRIEPKTREEALLISDVETAVKLTSENEVRHFNGAIVLRLVAADSSLQIAEMVHNVH